MIEDDEAQDQALLVLRAIRAVLLDDRGDPTPNARVLLEDLERFCHARATVHSFDDLGRIDPLASAQLEGRRQVWLRLEAYLATTEADIRRMIQHARGDTT